MIHSERESDYAKKYKRSDHKMRRISKEEKQRHPMEGYESSEEERIHQKAPAEQIVIKGANQRLSAGYNEDRRLTMVFSKDQHAGKDRDQELFRKEGSSPMSRNKKYLRSGTRNPEQSAFILEDREEKRKQYLLDQVTKSMDAPGNTLVHETFPFLNTKEEKERVRHLEDEARRKSLEREVVEENRKQAAALRQDMLHKEEERKNILKLLVSQVVADKAEVKRRRAPINFILQEIRLPESEEQEAEEDGNREQEF